ncbi:adaptor protein MecA [Lactobacillus sp. ESL0791]|uniref:adaptor protein MecA n=1 Tax=Lactobacillus sp. ESL0791 TaxID=2983234 RepID=UPI0023F7FC26|nr:adaptor protein MecA [Lactobacillus sp. ESL0791]MDF7638546.1 adaptor protein MecA [Lactobacillus sp. ESL0791]
MHVDHINENTIRVQIGKDELARRGLKVLDLLGDKNKIQHFFYSILDEIDTDHTFTQDVPVTFQVMPSKGGLDLLITKVTGSQGDNFAQMLGANPAAGVNKEEEAKKDSRRSFFDLAPDSASDTEKPSWQKQIKQLYCFKNLGAVIELADNLRVSELTSSLYFANDKYFLALAFSDENEHEVNPADVWVVADEFGFKVQNIMLEHIEKLGDCIFHDDALEQLRYYFTKSKH